MKNLNSIIENVKKIFYNDNDQLNIFGKLLFAIFIAIATIVISRLVHRIFKKYLLKNSEKFDNKLIDAKKSITISSAIDNTLKYIIYFFGLVLILEVFGIGKSITVGIAGIGGVALGFGAQSLVKDVISGIFIIFEDQYSIGDNVLINNIISGNVVEFGMKTTKIKGFDGSITMIGNGNITTVKNMSKGNQRAYVEIIVPESMGISDIEKVVITISEKFNKDNNVTVKPYLWGITDIGLGSSVKIAIVAWAKPGKQALLEMQIRELFIKEARRIGIEI